MFSDDLRGQSVSPDSLHVIYQKPVPIFVNGNHEHHQHRHHTQSPSPQPTQLQRFPTDLVLHARPRSSLAPHLSPFVMKLEAWLRVNNIPYTFTSKNGTHPRTGKMPWVEYNHGQIQLYDSEAIIQHFTKYFFDDGMSEAYIDYGMTDTELATMRAFQRMFDEHLYWAIPLWRFVRDPHHNIWSNGALPPTNALKKFIGKFVLGRNVKNAAHSQGLGRLDDAMLIERINEDLQATSSFLANKPFLMGQEVRSVDCSLFGHIAQLIWIDTSSPWTQSIFTRWPNLVCHAERMRTKCFPDWNQLTGNTEIKRPV